MKEPIRRWIIRPICNLLSIFPDKIYISAQYLVRVGKIPNLSEPKTFNEKMQWLKLNYRKPEFSNWVDKYEVKNIVKDLISEEYVVPSLGVWKRYEEIDFNALPQQFVLKTTNDSGGVILVNSKDKLNHRYAKRFLEGRLKFNYYWQSREWPYKNVKGRIIAEPYLSDNKSDKTLNVYKIFTFGGEAKIIQAIRNDKTEFETINYYDKDWSLLDIYQNHPNDCYGIDRPINLELMLELAEKLSDNLPFIRVDFYEVKGHVYFSEYTFYSDGGFAKFHPEKWDEILGDWISLP